MKKGILIGLIIGILLAGSIGTYAAIKLSSSEISYKDTTVEQTLNSLYISKTTDNYSEEEKVVGTWIDGRPIYSKLLTLNISNNTNYTFDAKELLAPDIDAIVNAVGYSLVDNGATIANFPCYYTSVAFLSEWMNYDTKLVHIIAGTQYKTAIHYLNFTYTKKVESED